MRAITIGMLKDQILTDNKSMLYCRKCGGEYSANSGDYFMTRADYVFKCCGVNLMLATKRTVFEAVPC